mgnify:CR=1|jgi:hypothetical protein
MIGRVFAESRAYNLSIRNNSKNNKNDAGLIVSLWEDEILKLN